MIGTLLYALAVVVILVSPVNSPHPRAGFLREDPPSRARGVIREDVLNVALFAPLGWGLRRIARRRQLRWPLLAVAVVAASFSFAIETVQYLLPYRYSSVTDIATNTLGAVIGAWCETGLNRLRQ